ncbi:MAG: sugar ABC transporter substrate-binding protein [Actinomycetota bacterium]
MKRRLVLFAIAGALAITAGCKGKKEGAAPTGVKVGLILPNASQPYYQAVRRAVDRVAAERGYEVLAEEGDGKSATQKAALERLAERGANAVLVSSIDPEELEPALEGAISKNVYAVVMERPIEDADTSSTVVFNHELAGQLLADFLGSELKSGGSVALLTGGGAPGEKKRAEAFRSYLAEKFPTIKIAAESSAKAAEAPAAAKKLIAGKKLDAAVALNADAGAALAAAIGAGAGKPFVATYGGREELIEGLKTEGPIRLVVEPLPQWLGERSAKLAWRIVTNKPAPSLVELPLQPVTRENLDTYHGWDGVIPENMNVPWTSELSLQTKREE